MEAPSPDALTTMLHAWSRGDAAAREKLFPLVYEELRWRAAAFLRQEQPGQTLQPTALVHEAYIRLCEQNAGWKNRSHFFAVSSQILRRILVEHVRARRAVKRAGGQVRVTLDEDVISAGSGEVDLIVVDEALEELAARSERQAKIVELRFFGGLALGEIASILGLSLATVNRDWRVAKAWLYQHITASG